MLMLILLKIFVRFTISNKNCNKILEQNEMAIATYLMKPSFAKIEIIGDKFDISSFFHNT